jgi:hypothetical protein
MFAARSVVLVACGEPVARDSIVRGFAGDARRITVLVAGDGARARALVHERGHELAAVICDEVLVEDDVSAPAWALLGEIELRFPDAYRAILCADTVATRALELRVHGGQPWARGLASVERIRARVLASACSLPALAIAACAIAEHAGLDERHAQLMAAQVLWRSRKLVADWIGIGEATAAKEVGDILAALQLPSMTHVAIEVLRRALARPLIDEGGGG